MKKGLILVLVCVLVAGVAGAETVYKYELVGGKGKFTQTNINLREDLELSEVLNEKTNLLRRIDSYNSEKANCDSEIAKLNARIADIDALVGQMVP